MFTGYRSTGYFDEMFDDHTKPRTAYVEVARGMSRMSRATFIARAAQVDRHYANHGITFAHGGREQTFPFDLLPRVIDAADWQTIEAG